MMAKNLPAGQRAWKIPFRILLDIISAWKSLFAGEATYFIAVIEAHWGFYKWLLNGRKKSNFPLRRNGFLYGYYTKSVIWKHFISGKNTFVEIVGNKG